MVWICYPLVSMDDWQLLFTVPPMIAPEDEESSTPREQLSEEPFAKELQRYYGEQLRKDVHLAQDFYRALCDNIWYGSTEETRGQKLNYSWRGAGEIIATVRTASGCPAEDYMDYYRLGNEGQISDEVAQKLRNLGYQLQP